MKENKEAQQLMFVRRITQSINERSSNGLKSTFADFKNMWNSARSKEANMADCLLFTALKDVYESFGLNMSMDSNSMPDKIDFSGVSVTHSSETEDI